MTTISAKVFVTCLLLGVACGGAEGITDGSALALRGFFENPENSLRAAIWTDDAIHSFNGIDLVNVSDDVVTFDTVTPREVGADLEIVGVSLVDLAELPPALAGPFTGSCGASFPPKGYPHNEPSGFMLGPGASAIVMIGVANPKYKAQQIEGLNVNYRVDGRSFGQSFHFDVGFGSERDRCSRYHHDSETG